MQHPVVKGTFEEMINAGDGHPPVLVVDIDTEALFHKIRNIVLTEAFLRFRKVTSYYQKIIINTVGDASELGPRGTEVYDYTTCKLNLEIEISKPPRIVLRRLDNAVVWSVVFIHQSKKLCIVVDKETEQLISRTEK